MNADDKKIIYNLLKISSQYTLGYTSQFFQNEIIFEDDKIPETDKITEKISIENEKIINKELPLTVNKQNISSTSKISLSEINSKISRCTRCQLARTRNNVVPGTGVLNPQVMVIGEGPGYDEDMSGLPFVGKAGKLLDKMLNAIQLDRNQNCYIANIVKCRPPQNRDPLPEEENACFSFLEAQIHILKPKMILCMGRIAGHKLLDTTLPLKELRSKFFEYNHIPVMVTYHPSALLRDESLKRPAWEDLKKFRFELNKIISSENQEIQINHSSLPSGV